MKTFKPTYLCMILATLPFFGPVLGQNTMDDVQIKVTNVRGNVFMLQGQGGNIGVLTGDDGVVIIDDQFEQLAEKIKTAIGGISDKPISFVINTHYHGDHTGGNAEFAKDGSMVIAHKNVRKRLSTEQFNAFRNSTTPPVEEGKWPIITFTQNIDLFWNNEEIHVIHTHKGHTDGDAVIYFKKANVIHAGDAFVTYGYPYIDTSAGGTLAGLIGINAEIIKNITDDTLIIPGHGPVSKKQDVQAFHDRLKEIHQILSAGVEAGKSADDLINEEALGKFNDSWNGGFIKMKDFITIVYPEIVEDQME